jgi:hypothetical protein
MDMTACYHEGSLRHHYETVDTRRYAPKADDILLHLGEQLAGVLELA